MGSGICKSFCVSSSFIAELWALREGLDLCVELWAQVVEVEFDASATISLVASNINSNGDLSSLVDDCRELLLQRPQVQVSYCFKEANCYADVQARLGLAEEDVSLNFASPPPSSVVPLLFADVLRMFWSRLYPASAGDFVV
ncbi:hypothetical protein SO802_009934 [Lithocarpus litseifolius]|uniref:RNase H type-1 domain-containing protein n=1 Tax=Lithocarpus litseifolius TaxID=425828 RepID=A0AAW2DF09_9ROSI